jgi:carboxymethylenebutenolidase
VIMLALGLTACLAGASDRDPPSSSETVVVQSGTLRLRATLWRPQGVGPFPAILFNHGSGRATRTAAGQADQLNRLREPASLGPTFAKHGYIFLYLFRRGAGLSAGQGTASGDLMDAEAATHGPEGRTRVQLRLLETDEMADAMAALAFLRDLPEVDSRRLGVVGHSFGGSLTLLLAERDPTLRAAVDFGGAAGSWEASPPLRQRLLAAVHDSKVPTLFIHAANDYSIAPGLELSKEMERLHRPHRIKVYPAAGVTADEGHRFVYLNVTTWEPDVFAFLAECMRR